MDLAALEAAIVAVAAIRTTVATMAVQEMAVALPLENLDRIASHNILVAQVASVAQVSLALAAVVAVLRFPLYCSSSLLDCSNNIFV
jgi:hypothetical protein